MEQTSHLLVLGEGGVYQGRGMPVQVWLGYSVCEWCVLGEGGSVPGERRCG